MSWWTKTVLLLTLLLALCGGVSGVIAAEPGSQGPPQKMRGRNNMPDKIYWRAFAEMSPEERSAMRRLQQQNPVEYATKMQNIVAEIKRREKAKLERISQLSASWKKAAENEQEAIRVQLRDIVKGDYQRRLEANRRHIADVRRRTEFLEKELAERELNADKHIDAMVRRILSEQKMPKAPQEKAK